MLGQDTAGIAGERSPEQLITEMCGSRAVTRYEKNERLLAAFWAGFGIMATEPQ